MMPGIQPSKVSINTIRIDPQPWSITDNGGKRIANNTRQKLIIKFRIIFLQIYERICILFTRKFYYKIVLITKNLHDEKNT